MSDPLFDSVYLDEQPRRARLSEARNRLNEHCGDRTLAGDFEQLSHAMEVEQRGGWKFWIQDGDRILPLKIGVNTIGRMQDNTVVLEDIHVSRHHCAIIVHWNGHCEVHDIASKNGTILNGEVVTKPTPIKPGDVLNLSNHGIVLCSKSTSVDEETPFPPSRSTDG